MKDRGDAVEHSTTLDPEKFKAKGDPTTEADSQSGDDLDGDNSRNHVFSDPLAAEHWRSIYEKAGYENRHRFDPGFTWTAEDERKLVRKVDLRIMTWAVSNSQKRLAVVRKLKNFSLAREASHQLFGAFFLTGRLTKKI